MNFENRHLFNGNINNKTVYDIKGKLDFTVNNLEERKKRVDEILSDKDETGRNFFETYFDEHYKAELNQSDALSENNNVCKTLEQMADYLLGSVEIREERKSGEQQYRFYMDRNEFNKVINREQSLNGKCDAAQLKTGISGSEDTVIHYLLQKSNYKKAKKQTITKSDLEKDDFCGEVLRAYQEYNDLLTDKLNNADGNGYKLRQIKGQIKQDMLYTKDSLNGVFGYKLRNELVESTVPCWDDFSWHNPEHVKALIYIQKEFKIDDDVSWLLYDLDMLIKKADGIFSDRELEVYNMIRVGYKNVEIAKMLELTTARVTQLSIAIAEKISKFAIKVGY